ncbi:MAG TPA: hypothetical protein GXZ93_05925 [Actinobacteria bacterium]|nr:hypothetical protein [Actinomycetota bacterium]
MENQNKIIFEINKIISEEIKILNSYYNYDLKRFFCPELFYGSAFLAFFNIEDIPDFIPDKNFKINNSLDGRENITFFDTYKIISLITGIELLAIGLNMHTSHENTFRKVSGRSENSEKNYTIELLFGDIFYSRAIAYLINFDNFIIFDNILKSILSIHRSRMIVHQKIKDIFDCGRNNAWFFNKGFSEVRMLNALLKEIFFTGIGVSNFDVTADKTKDFLMIINEMVLLKTYNDLTDYVRQAAPESFESSHFKYDEDFLNKADDLRKSLNIKINRLEPEWIKENFLKLFFKLA